MSTLGVYPKFCADIFHLYAEGLRNHFAKYGNITDAVIMKDRITGRPRGFGFVTFDNQDSVNRVLEEKHRIDGRDVRSTAFGFRSAVEDGCFVLRWEVYLCVACCPLESLMLNVASAHLGSSLHFEDRVALINECHESQCPSSHLLMLRQLAS